MRRVLICIAAVALALPGCAAQNFVRTDGAKCNALGFETGSANYENCMMIHSDARNFLAAEDRARAAQAPPAVPRNDVAAAKEKNIMGMCEANASCNRSIRPDEREEIEMGR
jgi:hypothetical protein